MVSICSKKLSEHKLAGVGDNDPDYKKDGFGGRISMGGVSGGGGYSSIRRQIQKYLLVILSLALISCSVKHDGPAGNTGTVKGIAGIGLKIDPNSDSDGDGIKDQDEINLGRNPFVAEMPELNVKFLQNYKIEVFYHHKNSDPVKDQKSFVIDTAVKDTNPDFKFRIGSVFARKNALKTAASFGRFASHSSGVFTEHDLSWVSYPDIDPKFFHAEAIKHRKVFNESDIVDDIKIILSNQVRLNQSAFFKEIKNLKLNFYYLNHETENYDVLTSTAIDRHFQGSVYESFDVVIDHAPVSLLKESFFKRGEFIVSEVDDFEIPAMSTNYKALIASVKAKTVPVLYETPLEEKIYYVAAQEGVSFQSILKAVFDRNYLVKEDVLSKIGQFENNLPGFTYLKEVKDKNKFGKWFIMTSEFKENFLDHGYTPKDRIVLSYITGTDLATQSNEIIYSYVLNIDGNKSESILPLGNITPNSKVEFTLHPRDRFGRAITKHHEVFNRPGGSCGTNCIQLAMNCTWEVNAFNDYYEEFDFLPDLLGEGEKLDLIINGDVFKLSELLKEKKILVNKTDAGIHVTINDISAIKEIKDFDENHLSLKVRSFAGSDFFGVKLVDMGGVWQGIGGCPFNTPAVAEKWQTQISTETREIGEISWLINDLAKKGYPYKFSLIDSGPYYQEIAIGVSSSIENYYN